MNLHMLHCRFLRDTEPVSSTSPIDKERAASAPQKIEALISSIHEVKRKQRRVIDAASSRMLAGACTMYEGMQSCLPRFRVDAEFVELIEKTKEELHRWAT